ncbi:DNA-binding NtrC family response regulator [Geothermobacter ehrlichii]|uniref:DNA-binding NtrC family response regulator n=1 Tax=Geothermobacter ehrlichii TaxID=213224 RepID=A0A5D3WGH5_9BACT|nr:sigma-54 dependent transcriptional regulator [Geothermobacter ehrlichii]TYO97541.1 DNA-binding NtrC family response regulator [Geothermobacter ehrlichii]
MWRLDARVSTELPARIYRQGSEPDFLASATISELSLSSALLDRNLDPELGPLLLRTRLPGGSEIDLQGQVVTPRRKPSQGTAIQLLNVDQHQGEMLWRFLREKLLPLSNCPYCACGMGRHTPAPRCPGKHCGLQNGICWLCGHRLDFANDSYLEEHLQDTFGPRLQTKLKLIDPERVRKILQLIDAELLKSFTPDRGMEFVGTHPEMLRVFSLIRKVAPTGLNVLILGESGTGKELTARAIHERSARRSKPFVVINCAAIPEGLLEAELFGYTRGAFTGAYQSQDGKFVQADGGTIFLDEIGDLPFGLQAKLLRFLEDRIVERLGGKQGRQVDVRVLAATNCDLESRIERGQFRQDLFYRLNGFTIYLPPLRDRGDDVVLIARYLLQKHRPHGPDGPTTFSSAALRAMRTHDWPGNVRELINRVRRAMVMATGREIEPVDLELNGGTCHRRPADLRSQVGHTERELIVETLKQTGYNVARSARTLGISRPALYDRFRKYDIDLQQLKREHHPN